MERRPEADRPTPERAKVSADSRRDLTRRALLGGVCACVGGGLFGLGYWRGRRDESNRYVDGRPTNTNAKRAAAQPNALFRVQTEEKVVALTFDDGPDPRNTPTVLDLLSERGALATFFTVGVNVRAHTDLLRETMDRGHVIGNHTYDHPDLELLGPAEVDSEIERAQTILVDAGAPRPRLFRPPKGYTDDAVGVLADANRYQTVFWDHCVERFLDGHTPKAAVDAIMRDVKPGSIILAHDGGHIEAPGKPHLNRRPTLEALPRLIERLNTAGYRFVTVPELLTLGIPAR